MKSRSPSKNCSNYISQDKLKIIIRIRPILNEQDYEQFVQLEDDNTLQIKRPGICTYMKFNNILPPTSTQKDMFSLVQDSIKQFLNGINMTIFAYGQTGAGKTYSMIGNYSPKGSQQNLFNFLSSKERGILSRSLQMIMSYIHKKKNNRVFVSFFQIYNQKIFDLYNNNMVPLDIRQSKNGQISIPDLLNVQIYNMQQAIQYLMIGLKNRATGSTHGNAQSSRSHSIFQISLQKQNQGGEMTYSSLRIVDLAGSQKFKIPSDLSPTQKQIRIQQLTSINGSLSCLGHCISALIQKSRTHIPFRNSKLTRILSDALLGQGKMRFIICISPSLSASAETFSTLQFANRAKKAIFQRSQMRTPNLSKKKSSENEQITTLRRQLEKQREIRTHLESQLNSIMSERPEGLIKQNAYLRKQNEKLKQQLKQLMVKKQSQKTLSPQQSFRKSHQYSPTLIANKQNITGQDLKQQMLRLPIFQNKRSLDILQQKLQNNKNDGKNGRADGNKIKQNKQTTPINKKKAQFEKKIRRFIQSDSPSKQIQINNKSQNQQRIKQSHNLSKDHMGMAKYSPSFTNKQNKEHLIEKMRKNNQNYLPPNINSIWNQMQQSNEGAYVAQRVLTEPENNSYMRPSKMVKYQQKQKNNQKQREKEREKEKEKEKEKQMFNNIKSSSQDQQWIQNEDTQQLIEQACQKMNLPDFRDLKSQMDRAKHQLILLKQKDDEISKKKAIQLNH